MSELTLQQYLSVGAQQLEIHFHLNREILSVFYL